MIENKINILDDIKISNITSTDQAIIDYINDKPDLFLNMNIKEFSKTVNVGISSVTRFVQKTGYKDFKRFQFDVYHKTIERNSKYMTDDASQSIIGRFKESKTSSQYSLDKTLKEIDLNQINRLIQDIKNADKIFTYGMGSSFLAAQELSNNFLKIGKNIICQKDFHTMLFSIPSMNKNKNDIAILFSKTGKTKETRFFTEQLIRKRIKVVLITGNEEVAFGSTLFEKISFKTPSRTGVTTEVSSKISEMTLVDLIFLSYVDQNMETQNFRLKELEMLKKWDEFR